MNHRVDVVVAVSDDARTELASVAERLARLGFALSTCLPEAGVLLGTAPEGALGVMAAVPGVLAIERQRSGYAPR
jgi:hypothetical protein